jgi:phage protein D
MSASTTPELRAARPTFLVDGREQVALAASLRELEVRETHEGLAALAASFGNWGEKQGVADYLYADRVLLDFGKRLEVRFGDDAVFKGRIMALEGEYPEAAPPGLGVLAEDTLQDLRMTRRTRSFEDQSDRDVFTRIAQEHGLRADLDLDGPTWPVLAQLNQSDLAFLRDRARMCGIELWLADETLHASPRSDRAGQAIRLERGKDLVEFRVLADLAHQATRLIVSGWDVDDKRRVEHAADDAVLGAELGRDQSGAAILRGVLGERPQSVVHTLARTIQEAQAEAEALFRATARRFVCGEGRAEANAQLRVGRSVELAGFGATFDGRYALVEVCHRFDPTLGLRSEIRVERPGVGSKA